MSSPRTPRTRRNARTSDLSSPMQFPGSSSPMSSPRGRGRGRRSRSARRSDRISSDDQPGSAPNTPGSVMSSVMTPNERSDLGGARRQQHYISTGGITSDDIRGGPGGPPSSSQASPAGSSTVIWGTTVNVTETMRKFRKFFLEFTEPGKSVELYPDLLKQIKTKQIYNINLDCTHLYDWSADHELYYHVVNYPQEVIPIFDLVIHDLFKIMFPEHQLLRRIQVRTMNLRPTELHAMRDLNPEDIDKMVALKGMIIRTTSVIPELKRAFFQCTTCDNTHEEDVFRGRVEEPTLCSNCQARNSMQLVHNRSMFADKQIVKMQEAPESIPEGETPQTVNLFAFDDLVDVAKPGDRVEITGVYRAYPVRPSKRQRNVMAVYPTYVDVLHFKKSETGRMTDEDPDADPASEYHTTFDERADISTLAAEKEKRMRALGADPNIYDKLAAAIAPGVYELTDTKKGLLLQLFGGTNKSFQEDTSGKFRGEINVLMCGDPGTAKSQLLSFIHKIAPRGIYTSGKGSSAVGLTAYITKDPDTGENVLESGALVLSDHGVCCIDEFDKMSDSTRAVLHEAMEQQTVSIAKAGIICTLNARTSILACANPKESKYNTNMSVVDNIQLPPTLLSRFDLIYLVLDPQSVDADKRLARHLIGLYYEKPTIKKSDITSNILTEYISYARKAVQPTISDEAFQDLVQAYVDMRKIGQNRRTVTATPRQLESLIRLSEARARLRLSPTVSKADVAEAVRLMKVALQQAATNADGTIDIDLIAVGSSAAGRTKLEQLKQAVVAALEGMSAPSIKFFSLHSKMQESSDVPVTREELREALEQLREHVVLTNVRQANFTIRKTF